MDNGMNFEKPNVVIFGDALIDETYVMVMDKPSDSGMEYNVTDKQTYVLDKISPGGAGNFAVQLYNACNNLYMPLNAILFYAGRDGVDSYDLFNRLMLTYTDGHVRPVASGAEKLGLARKLIFRDCYGVRHAMTIEPLLVASEPISLGGIANLLDISNSVKYVVVVDHGRGAVSNHDRFYSTLQKYFRECPVAIIIGKKANLVKLIASLSEVKFEKVTLFMNIWQLRRLANEIYRKEQRKSSVLSDIASRVLYSLGPDAELLATAGHTGCFCAKTGNEGELISQFYLAPGNVFADMPGTGDAFAAGYIAAKLVHKEPLEAAFNAVQTFVDSHIRR